MALASGESMYDRISGKVLISWAAVDEPSSTPWIDANAELRKTLSLVTLALPLPEDASGVDSLSYISFKCSRTGSLKGELVEFSPSRVSPFLNAMSVFGLGQQQQQRSSSDSSSGGLTWCYIYINIYEGAMHDGRNVAASRTTPKKAAGSEGLW